MNSLIRNSIRIIFGILLAVIIIFMWQNWNTLIGSVTLKFISSAEYPLWIWLAAVFLTGNITWAVFSIKNNRFLKRALNQKSTELKNSKSELDKFRNLSIKEESTPSGSDTSIQKDNDEK